jgi:hypothetical protein
MSGSLPPSPAVGRSVRSISVGSAHSPSLTTRSLRSTAIAGMPSPQAPFVRSTSLSQSLPTSRRTSAPQNMAKSMTIEEMRQLHHKALSDAEAKRTELRLVLASRYRELVGSSDEVIRMRERSEELHQLVHAIPQLIIKLVNASKPSVAKESKDSSVAESSATVAIRRDLAKLPRMIHRALDQQDVHKAATALLQLFSLIASLTDKFPLANALGNTVLKTNVDLDPLLFAQLKMTYLHVETIPARSLRMAKTILLQAASNAHRSAAALCTLSLMHVPKPGAVPLLDLYFDSKAKLLQSLLNQLITTSNNPIMSPSAQNQQVVQTDNAEMILSQIVAILQYDIILHPYQIFVLRNIPDTPLVESELVKTKASHFLAAHLPLIRTKVKSVLVSIAGTTASALGQIRQSLYDKTDGALSSMDENWQDAVSAVVDVKIVLSQQGSSKLVDETRKFSLWSALFSNTFSNLVHSLLTTSFHSVHVKVASTLRTSLANAPPFSSMLPHEAYRNTLKIATDMNDALLKVSDDAHELLVHAEEREESERRLRQSLYVQTCEIMGRLVCELRRMLLHKINATEDATKEFLVGRLCHLLKFRLTALADLLNPQHSPAVLGGGGMITLLELQSAFDLADDNDDGLITFEEAMEAVDSAFSGTQFHGAEMVRETLLLSNTKEDGIGQSSSPAVPSNVTLKELALLSARGLTHEVSGPKSALGTIQQSLDDIIDSCFAEWAKAALSSASITFRVTLADALGNVVSATESEWQRIYGGETQNLVEFSEYLGVNVSEQSTPGSPIIGNVSPFMVGYFLTVASVLNRSVCPSDSMSWDGGSSMVATIRQSLLKESLRFVATTIHDEVTSAAETKKLGDGCASALIQLKVDFGFVLFCLFERNKHGFSWRQQEESDEMSAKCKSSLSTIISDLDRMILNVWASSSLQSSIDEHHRRVLEMSELYLSSLFGEADGAILDVDIDVSNSGLSGKNAATLNPLPSSRRFGLLPIQESDRSLAELQRRGNKYDKEVGRSTESSGSGVIGSGLGFFSAMLKKK